MPVVSISRRLAALAVAAVLCALSIGLVQAASGDSVSIDVSVPDHGTAPYTVSLSGTWSWSEFTTACGPGTKANRAAGWAVDWGEGFAGNRVQRKGSKPASFLHMGTAADNTVHRSSANGGLGDCGTPVPGGVAGTWGPITHTYAHAGTYTACVNIYDVHYKMQPAPKPKKGVPPAPPTIVPASPKEIVAGSNAGKYGPGDHNADNTAETKTGADAQCRPITFRVFGPSAIHVVKDADVSSAHVGDTVTYTFDVTNTGDAPLHDINVIDPKCDSGTLGGPTGNTGSPALLDTTETWTYTCTHVVTAGELDPLHNTVTVTGTDEFGDTVNDTDSADVHIVANTADLQITKTDGVSEVASGGSTTYTVVVTNAGSITVTGATVDDDHPFTGFAMAWSAVGTGGASGFTADSSVLPPPAELHDTVTLPPGATITYTITMDTPGAASGDFTNTATVTAPAGITDPYPANNSASDTDTMTHPVDTAVSKTDYLESVDPGQQVTYKVVVTNYGPFPATPVHFTDPVPDGLTGVTWTATGTAGAIAYNTSGSGSIDEQIGVINSGDNVTYTITGTVAAGASGSISNVATVDLGDHDPVTANNTDTDTDPIRTLHITKTQDGGSPTGAFTFQVTGGPDNVDVLKQTVAGNGNLDWAGLKAGDYTLCERNISPVFHSSLLEAPYNGTNSADGGGSTKVCIPLTLGSTLTSITVDNATIADIEITKTDGVTTVEPGQHLTYHIDVYNHALTGPAVTFHVRDFFPLTLTNISWTCTGATLGGSSPATCGLMPLPVITGTFDETVTLSPGGHVGYTVLATVNTATGTVENNARAIYAADPNQANNSVLDIDTVDLGGGCIGPAGTSSAGTTAC